MVSRPHKGQDYFDYGVGALVKNGVFIAAGCLILWEIYLNTLFQRVEPQVGGAVLPEATQSAVVETDSGLPTQRNLLGYCHNKCKGLGRCPVHSSPEDCPVRYDSIGQAGRRARRNSLLGFFPCGRAIR